VFGKSKDNTTDTPSTPFTCAALTPLASQGLEVSSISSSMTIVGKVSGKGNSENFRTHRGRTPCLPRPLPSALFTRVHGARPCLRRRLNPDGWPFPLPKSRLASRATRACASVSGSMTNSAQLTRSWKGRNGPRTIVIRITAGIDDVNRYPVIHTWSPQACGPDMIRTKETLL
jgi:hypothetical protein